MANYNRSAGYGQQHFLDVGSLGSGKVFVVGGDNTTNKDMIKDLFGVDPDGDVRFFSTINAAVGECTNGAGDTVLVLPNYTETITSEGAIDTAQATGVKIIGIGNSADRPSIRFGTSTAADIKVSEGVRISNFTFSCNIANQLRMLEVEGQGVEIDHCTFEEGSATGLRFITTSGNDNDCDDLYIHDNEFFAPTAGNYDEAIAIVTGKHA